MKEDTLSVSEGSMHDGGSEERFHRGLSPNGSTYHVTQMFPIGQVLLLCRLALTMSLVRAVSLYDGWASLKMTGNASCGSWYEMGSTCKAAELQNRRGCRFKFLVREILICFVLPLTIISRRGETFYAAPKPLARRVETRSMHANSSMIF